MKHFNITSWYSKHLGWFEYEAHINKTKGWLMGGKGGVPPLKNWGAFMGSLHMDSIKEKGEREHYMRQNRREEKRKWRKRKKGGKRGMIFFFFFSQVNDFYQLSIEVKIWRQIEIKDRNSLNSVLQLGTCRCIVL